MHLDAALKNKLVALGQALVDQQAARVVVEPYERGSGFWFGGGNLIRDNGWVWIVGRYRNPGDSRTGVQLGTRGLEVAVWRSPDGLADYQLAHKWSKVDLTCEGRQVISIEGTALHRSGDGIELFVSSEKELAYPAPYQDAQKPGTGIWTIDRMCGSSVEALDPATLRAVPYTTCPAALHIKDPVAANLVDGATALIFCTHPYSWSSSNSALAIRRAGQTRFDSPVWNILRRGNCWDVAVSRVTDVLRVPRVGVLAGLPQINLYFYDGAECIHDHGKTGKPRGHSCEEIGGLAWGWDGEFPTMKPLSVEAPLFVSPWGSGCSRYVKTLVENDGILAAWQQSQPDGSQPLVAHKLTRQEIERIFS